MANLLTHHDKFHSHAIFGALALLHFLWRFIQTIRFGTSFPDHEPRWFQTAGVLIHLLLPLLSFQLPLPEKRHTNKPMLWHEGRLHSLIFATRHIVATLCSLWNLWPNPNNRHVEKYSSAWFLSLAAEILVKEAMVLATCQLAKLVSEKYGDTTRRTTNSMPYPDNVDESFQIVIKSSYASFQFVATSYCLLGDPTVAFWPVFPIQGAAFLMTLVRKGLISPASYHRGYILQVIFNHWILVAQTLHGNAPIHVVYAFVLALSLWRKIRIVHGYSAVGTWSIGVAVHVIGWALIGEWLKEQALNVWFLKVFKVLAVVGMVPWIELPLFFGSNFEHNLMKHLLAMRNLVMKNLYLSSDAFRPAVEKKSW